MKFPDSKVFTSGNIQARKGSTCRLYLKSKQKDGTWKSISKTYRAKDGAKLGVKEAEQALRDWHDEEEDRATRKLLCNAQTIEELVTRYVETKALSVERSTASEYRRLSEKIICPQLGEFAPYDLSADMVQEWVKSVSKRYAPVTTKKALVLLRSALSRAVKAGALANNPTDTVETPRGDTGQKPNVLTERDRVKVRQFIGIDGANPVHIGFALALELGMRKGEICGLRWRDVDLKQGTVAVLNALGVDKDKSGGERYYDKRAKSESGTRTLPLPDELERALASHMGAVKAAALAAGVNDISDMYVIGKLDGNPMLPNYLSKRWRTTAEALNLTGTQGKRPTLHDLRHTFATEEAYAGTNQYTLAQRMGHSSIEVTNRYYIGLDARESREAMRNKQARVREEMARYSNSGEILELKPTGTEA